MYVTQLRQTLDECEFVIENPTLDQIEEAIGRLNGGSVSDLIQGN